MVTRFSAAEAQQTVQLAKKRAEVEKQMDEQRRLKQEALRLNQERIQAEIDSGWATQRVSIIEAAMDGKKETTLLTPIYKFKNLLDLGFCFVEVGWVNNQEIETDGDQCTYQDYERRDGMILSLEEGVRILGEDLIVSAHADWRKYYSSHERFVESIKYSVEDAIDSTSGLHDTDYVIWSDVSPRLRRKYSVHFLHLTNAVRFLKKSRNNPAYGLPKILEKKREDMIHGEYIFSCIDETIDIFGTRRESSEDEQYWVNEDENYYKLKWTAETTPDFMLDPLFTKNGLNWISEKVGQNLLEAVFNCVRDIAAKGKNEISLEFKLTGDGWYFIDGIGNHYPSCLPDELVEIIERQDFTILDTFATSKAYKIKVKW